MIKARPTIYKGIQMRSRLEAEYAQHLDAQGLDWKYEPMCYASHAGQYLPDFEVQQPYSGRSFVEVKPDPQWVNRFAHLERMHIIRASVLTAPLVVACKRSDGRWDIEMCSQFNRCARCAELDDFIDEMFFAAEPRRTKKPLPRLRTKPPPPPPRRRVKRPAGGPQDGPYEVDYSEGDLVQHQTFGVGTVTRFSLDDQCVSVNFNGHTKRLVPSWAPMQRVK